MDINKAIKAKISSYFVKRPEVLAVYLYGSQAKGFAREDSDIDLAILVKDHKSFSGFDIPQTRYLYDLEKLTGKRVEVQDLAFEPIDFAQRVISEGRILVGLNSKKRIEFEENILRVYFDLKPSIDEYYKYLNQMAKRGELDVRYI
ncbi:MAG: putative nucleotidyltransferase [Microgenomates group bacterium GW2011_GWC1_37_8]|uniref:Putative nucleotidyltransferase n=1 Tax=Candidatus Woesebacteria bacterium GW2011_GWB1_38_8 TaxID=1618570 RepID=A0A0G0NIY5_9BACT|nr:MAG: putative nucleotidyltransferase [Microgenomates group bacterium GW2011_GWC1_37_8]KKQ85864.1 MAG: putative nucleotidyltransferase [Candidatus Woesebacteria bacterium GW2011_GWB1_38_8]